MILLWIGVARSSSPARLAAQNWNDPPARALVERAVERRLQSFADSTLRSYSARARGVVTFRAEFGPELALAPKAVKADEIAVEVYWQRPDRSKQIIRAWRDSTLVPTALSYHRDHLGIVTDDFGPVIRIGDGEEVADVVHPLAPDGPAWYDYRLRDTVVIQTPSGRLVLVALEVRPKQVGEPRAVGTLFLDRDRAQVVRSHLTFTPAAYRDGDLEDITVRLERALVEDRYWLPYTQQIEIRRRSAVVDFPLRGVIRGDWVIGDYQINPDLGSVLWAGPSIGGLRRPEPGAAWSAPLEAVADSSLAPRSRRELAAIRSAALRVARARVLDGLPRVGLAVSRVSDVFRVNRVQGLVVGAGVGWRGPVADRLRVDLGYGFSDRRLTDRLEAARAVGDFDLRLRATRSVTDVGDVEVVSPLINSIAAQEWGRDHGDYVLLERVGLEVAHPLGPATRLALSVDREWSASVVARARPARGGLRPNPALGGAPLWVATARFEAARSRLGGLDGALRIAAETGVGAGGVRYGRVMAFGQADVPAPIGVVGIRGMLGIASGEVPARRSFAFGGVGTLVGEPFRAYGGRRAGWLGVDWLVPLPGPSISLGWIGRTSSRLYLGPVVALGAAGGQVALVPWRPTDRVPVVAGIALELFDRVVRLEIGKSLTSGRGPVFGFDLSRTWWPIL